MAYKYNEITGNFEEIPDGSSGSGSSGQDPHSHNWKKWLKIAGKIALPVVGVVLVAVTGIPIPHDGLFHSL